MLANHGYQDGSGEYYITIDTDKCNGCGKCVLACPAKVLVTVEDSNDPFRDIPIAVVADDQRKKIKYACAPCKPTFERKILPCIAACEPKALTHSW